MARNLKDKLLYILVNRTTIFFLIIGLLTLFLYAAGTVQGFIDSTQVSLLRLYSVLGIFLTVISICGVFLDLGRYIRSKKGRYLARAGGYALLVIFGAATVLAAMLIVTLSGGSGA